MGAGPPSSILSTLSEYMFSPRLPSGISDAAALHWEEFPSLDFFVKGWRSLFFLFPPPFERGCDGLPFPFFFRCSECLPFSRSERFPPPLFPPDQVFVLDRMKKCTPFSLFFFFFPLSIPRLSPLNAVREAYFLVGVDDETSPPPLQYI